MVAVNAPSRTALQQRPRPAQQLATGFHQPGYNPKDPRGLWGKGVPPEYRDTDYELIKSLATVEKDLDIDERLVASLGLDMPAMRVAGGQQLAVGGVDIEGGQGESDSIFGSHDDHSTYGVAGSGWQGAGNGEPPGELWNPAVGRTRVFPGQQLRQLRMRQALAGPVPYPEPGPEWYATEWGKHKHGK